MKNKDIKKVINYFEKGQKEKAKKLMFNLVGKQLNQIMTFFIKLGYEMRKSEE